MQQAVEHGATPVARGGMHDQTGRLVDDEQRFILENDVERDVFRLVYLVANICRLADKQGLSSQHLALGFGFRAAVDLHAALLDPALQAVTGMLR